jgi:hypothetical protein
MQKETELEALTKQLILKKFEDDGQLTEEIKIKYPCLDKLLTYASSRYSAYTCTKCNELFALRNLCGDVNGEDDSMSALCGACTIKGGPRLKISLWRPNRQSHELDALSHCTSVWMNGCKESYSTSELFCSSIENIGDQQAEVEVLQSV